MMSAQKPGRPSENQGQAQTARPSPDQEIVLRLMADTSPLGFLIVDHPRDKILYCNPRFCQIWGITHLEEALQRGELAYSDLLPACLPIVEDADAFTASCKALEDMNNHSVIEDEIPFTNSRTTRRYSSLVRGAPAGDSRLYLGRFYLYEDITPQKQAEAALRAALHEKELLLKEIHHRVKNNLQIITSLLGLQAVEVEDTPIYEAFREAQNRVKTMALIHERFHQSQDVGQVNFGEYLQRMSIHLSQSYNKQASGVYIFTAAENCMLSLEQAIPCGLIVNELVSNALKYAFPEDTWQLTTPQGRPEIRVSLAESTAGNLELTVQDNGVGLPPGFDWSNSDTLGLEIVISLVEQLRGSIEVTNQGGVKYSFQFSA